MTCSVCGKTLATETSEYDYTRDVALDPTEYRVILKRIRVHRCDCGEAPEICGMEQLHSMIAALVAGDRNHLRPSGLRFLRRFLGMTQTRFAALIRSTSVSVSNWETGKTPMGIHAETNARSRVLAELVRRELPQLTESPGDTRRMRELLARLTEMTEDIEATGLPVEISVSPWMIDAIERRQGAAL